MFSIGQSQSVSRDAIMDRARREELDKQAIDKKKKLYQFFDYTLQRDKKPIPEDEVFTLFATGCIDGNPTAQKQVLECMANKIKTNNEGIPPLFIFGLGDNGSGTGTTNPNSDFFRKNFHDSYNLSQPYLSTLGNHDVNAQNGSVDLDRAYAQIAHTNYDSSGNIDAKKKALFEQLGKTLDLDALTAHPNKWNMLGRYGVLHCGNTDFFYLDSNTFVQDFIDEFLNPSKMSHNLVRSLFQAIQKSTAVHKIVLMHNPPRTIDKRFFHSDHEKYLPASSIKILQKHGIIGRDFNYNMILANILFFAGNEKKKIPEGPGKLISLVLAAHHHANHYFNNRVSPKRDSANGDEKKQDKTGYFPYPLTQAVVGAGGCGTKAASNKPGLQNRYSFLDDSHQAFFGKAIGFLSLQIYKDSLRLIFHTVDADIPKNRLPGIHDLELQFTDLSNNPLHNTEETDDRMLLLRTLLFQACSIFLKLNSPDAPPKIAGKVIERIAKDFVYLDKLRNFFNNFTRPTFEQAMQYIKETHAEWPKLYNILQSHFEKETGETLDEFFNRKINNPSDTTHNGSPPLTAIKNISSPAITKNVSLDPTFFALSPKPVTRLNGTGEPQTIQAERKTNIGNTNTA